MREFWMFGAEREEREAKIRADEEACDLLAHASEHPLSYFEMALRRMDDAGVVAVAEQVPVGNQSDHNGIRPTVIRELEARLRRQMDEV